MTSREEVAWPADRNTMKIMKLDDNNKFSPRSISPSINRFVRKVTPLSDPRKTRFPNGLRIDKAFNRFIALLKGELFYKEVDLLATLPLMITYNGGRFEIFREESRINRGKD